MKKTLTPLAMALAVFPALAGSYGDLSRDWNRNGRDVTTLVLGGTLKGAGRVLGGTFEGVELFFVADSTHYGEAGAGLTVKLGPYATTAPYLLVERVRGESLKLRVLLLTTAGYGNFSAVSVIEAGGITGNFYTYRLGYTLGRVGLFAEEHSAAGTGLRVSYETKSWGTPYFRALFEGKERRLTLGWNKSFF